MTRSASRICSWSSWLRSSIRAARRSALSRKAAARLDSAQQGLALPHRIFSSRVEFCDLLVYAAEMLLGDALENLLDLAPGSDRSSHKLASRFNAQQIHSLVAATGATDGRAYG